MRTLRLGLAALAFGFVTGCSGKSGALAELKTTPAEAEAYIAKLSTDGLKGKATAAADIASVRDALPKGVALTWQSLTFDAAAGATVLTGVKIAPADMPDIGVSIGEVRLWDFDAAFAKARLTAQRMTETASLARRIEAKNIAVFGLETLMGPAMDAAEKAAGAAAAADPQAAAQLPAAGQMKADKYEISMASFVLDDVVLRPYELKPAQLPANNDFAEAMPFLQAYAAAIRTVAFDTMSAKSLAVRFDMTDAGERVAANVTVDHYGARGMRGGDTDVAFLRNLKLDMSMPNPELPSAKQMTIAGGVDFYSFEGMRFDKLYSYLAKGQWPPRTDTNLMSIGLFQAKGEHFLLNGYDIFSVGDATIDMRDWYWFIPTKVRLAANNVAYDIDAIMKFATETGGNNSPASAGKPPVLLEEMGEPLDPRIMQVLAKYGLTKPSLDYSLGWNWNPQTGAAAIDGAFGLDDFLRFDLKFDGGLPTFKSVSDLIPDDPAKADAAAIGKVFEMSSSLKSAEMNIVDEGGLDKGFPLAVEIGQLIPTEPGEPNFFASQTPQSLRQLAVSTIYSLADQAAAQLPASRDLLRPFATFVEKGGKVHISMKPKAPINASNFGTSVATGQSDPAVLLQQLNVKVEHTPPPTK